ncbi:hypothetical protein CHUAL_007571 [Chamberlinius hualienensis]
MGNCLKTQTSDDISLLRGGSEGGSSGGSGGGGGGGPRDSTSSADQLGPPPPYQESANLFYPSPNVSRSAAQLSEEEQIKIAQRIGMIQHLPTGIYDGSKKNRECVICMVEFGVGEPIRFLPCMHTYHTSCIDDWLMRSFTCPSCMEPVDSALLTTYETNN